MSFVDVGPHEFEPLRRSLLGWLLDVPVVCARCYHDEFSHPLRHWAEARPLGDRTDRPPRYAPFDRRLTNDGR